MRLENRQTLLFMGDSITDCGRARPVGAGWGLGNGYVSMVDALLGANYPETHVRVLNVGIGGDRVTDLEARWDADVLSLQPDWLSVMIGINDVWKQFSSALEPKQVVLSRYREIYARLLGRTRNQLKGLVLMTPFYIEPNRAEPMRKMMDEYGAVVKELAAAHDAVFVDVQAAFDEWTKHNPSQRVAGDRVHPNATGHMIIARAFLKATGFEWR
jgi:lysophospholipase L1-like esterase